MVAKRRPKKPLSSAEKHAAEANGIVKVIVSTNAFDLKNAVKNMGYHESLSADISSMINGLKENGKIDKKLLAEIKSITLSKNVRELINLISHNLDFEEENHKKLLRELITALPEVQKLVNKPEEYLKKIEMEFKSYLHQQKQPKLMYDFLKINPRKALTEDAKKIVEESLKNRLSKTILEFEDPVSQAVIFLIKKGKLKFGDAVKILAEEEIAKAKKEGIRISKGDLIDRIHLTISWIPYTKYTVENKSYKPIHLPNIKKKAPLDKIKNAFKSKKINSVEAYSYLGYFIRENYKEYREIYDKLKKAEDISAKYEEFKELAKSFAKDKKKIVNKATSILGGKEKLDEMSFYSLEEKFNSDLNLRALNISSQGKLLKYFISWKQKESLKADYAAAEKILTEKKDYAEKANALLTELEAAEDYRKKLLEESAKETQKRREAIAKVVNDNWESFH